MNVRKMLALLDQHDPTLPLLVEIDGVTASAGPLHSYRGFYEDLAIDFGPSWERAPIYATVGDLRAALQNAIGSTFEGHKGGDYTMDELTPLWLAPDGSTTPSGQPGEIVIRDGSAVLRAFHHD